MFTMNAEETKLHDIGANMLQTETEIHNLEPVLLERRLHEPKLGQCTQATYLDK
jgi:hypothetical protein